MESKGNAERLLALQQPMQGTSQQTRRYRVARSITHSNQRYSARCVKHLAFATARRTQLAPQHLLRGSLPRRQPIDLRLHRRTRLTDELDMMIPRIRITDVP